MRLWSKYIREPFLRALTEVPWFGPVVSAVLVALLVNILTEALTTWGGLWLGWAVVGVLAAATVAFVYAYHLSETRRRRRGLGPLIDLPNPEKHQGLIFLFSREDTLREAIKYHRPALEHCWLLVTPEMRDQAARALDHFPDLPFTLHPLGDRYDSQTCYETVRDIYRREAPRLGIPPERVIADITGGTKPMTLGMIVACLEGDYPIEHVPTAFDTTGRPTGPLPPIQIKMRSTAHPPVAEE
ncbi:MAG TPA: hypothetical protein EYP49_00635 [Anaerolineae bacterium]|nr:hypothetical protein [Anaerolineae bacterium]